MRLFLIRHPRPAVSPGICYGRTDLALADAVADCAARLRPLLPAGASVFSSPLRRCRELAAALGPFILDDRLRELDFGAWEMRPWTEIERSALDAWAADPLGFAAPRGESVAQLRKRVAQFLTEQPRAADAILVTHAGVMRACLAELTTMPEAQWLSARFDYGSVSLIEDGRLAWHSRSD